MNSPWRFFIVIESLLFVAVLWQLVHNTDLLILAALGVFLFAVSRRRHSNKNSRNIFGFLGIIFLLFGLFNSWAFWLMLIFAIVFIGLKGVEVSGVQVFSKIPWQEKKMMRVDTVEPDLKGGRCFKRDWFSNDRIGTTQVYEWDDVNLTVLSGDTIIDLGNTLLPKNDSVILVRKGFGRTRVLVPAGIGVMVEHAALYGDLHFDDETYQLKNEAIKLFSDDYDTNERRLKIVTSALIGDLEVIRV